MARTIRDFTSRPAAERAFMIKNTWCKHCNAADLGLTDPVEYEEGGVRYLEGLCRQCRERVISEIHEHGAA
jgi:hypothetical protein